MRKLLSVLAAVVLVVPATTFAGLVVFEDFESTTAGSTVDALTGTVGGTWGDYWQDGLGPGFVQDQAATGVAPTTGGGLNYLDVSDDNRDSFLDFDPSVVSSLVDGVPIKLEYDIYRVGGTWGHLFIMDDSGGDTSQGEFQYELGYWPDTANVHYRAIPYVNGGARTDAAGVAFPGGTWLHLSFEQTLGSNNATITIGANSLSVTDSTSMSHVWTVGECAGCGDGSIGQLKWTISTGARYFVDNISLTIIPEPGTFGLMLGGLLLVGVRRLRRR